MTTAHPFRRQVVILILSAAILFVLFPTIDAQQQHPLISSNIWNNQTRLFGELPCPNFNCTNTHISGFNITTSSLMSEIFTLDKISFSMAGLPSGEYFSLNENNATSQTIAFQNNNMSYKFDIINNINQSVDLNENENNGLIPNQDNLIYSNSTHIVFSAILKYSTPPKKLITGSAYEAQFTMQFVNSKTNTTTTVESPIFIQSIANANQLVKHTNNTAEISAMTASTTKPNEFQFTAYIPSVYNQANQVVSKVRISLYGPWFFQPLTPSSYCTVNTYNLTVAHLNLTQHTYQTSTNALLWYKALDINLETILIDNLIINRVLFPHTIPLTIQCHNVIFTTYLNNPTTTQSHYISRYKGDLGIDLLFKKDAQDYQSISLAMTKKSFTIGHFIHVPDRITSKSVFLPTTFKQIIHVHYPIGIDTSRIIYNTGDYFTILMNDIDIDITSGVKCTVYQPRYRQSGGDGDDEEYDADFNNNQFGNNNDIDDNNTNQLDNGDDDELNSLSTKLRENNDILLSSLIAKKKKSILYSTTLNTLQTTIINKHQVTIFDLPLQLPFPSNIIAGTFTPVPDYFVIELTAKVKSITPSLTQPKIPSMSTIIFSTTTRKMTSDIEIPIHIPVTFYTKQSTETIGNGIKIAENTALSFGFEMMNINYRLQYDNLQPVQDKQDLTNIIDYYNKQNNDDDDLNEPDPWESQQLVIHLALPRNSSKFSGDFRRCDLYAMPPDNINVNNNNSNLNTFSRRPMRDWIPYYPISGYRYNISYFDPTGKSNLQEYGDVAQQLYFNSENDFFYNKYYTNMTRAYHSLEPATYPRGLGSHYEDDQHILQFILQSSLKYPIHDKTSLKIVCPNGHIDKSWDDVYGKDYLMMQTVQIIQKRDTSHIADTMTSKLSQNDLKVDANNLIFYRTELISFTPHEISDLLSQEKARIMLLIVVIVGGILLLSVVSWYLQIFPCCKQNTTQRLLNHPSLASSLNPQQQQQLTEQQLHHHTIHKPSLCEMLCCCFIKPKKYISPNLKYQNSYLLDDPLLIHDDSMFSTTDSDLNDANGNPQAGSLRPNPHHRLMYKQHNQLAMKLNNHASIHHPSKEFMHTESQYQPMFE